MSQSSNIPPRPPRSGRSPSAGGLSQRTSPRSPYVSPRRSQLSSSGRFDLARRGTPSSCRGQPIRPSVEPRDGWIQRGRGLIEIGERGLARVYGLYVRLRLAQRRRGIIRGTAYFGSHLISRLVIHSISWIFWWALSKDPVMMLGVGGFMFGFCYMLIVFSFIYIGLFYGIPLIRYYVTAWIQICVSNMY